jgi:hypothetical protein
LLPVAVDLGFWTDLFILSNRTNPIDLACVDTGTYLSLLLGEGERVDDRGEERQRGEVAYGTVPASVGAVGGGR